MSVRDVADCEQKCLQSSRYTYRAERIEWFKEGQAFLPPRQQLSLFLSLPVCRRYSFWRGGEGWAWIRIIRKKAWPSTHHSIHSKVGPWVGFTFLRQSSQTFLKTAEQQYHIYSFLSHYCFEIEVKLLSKVLQKFSGVLHLLILWTS